MRLINYEDEISTSWGLVVGDGVVDVGRDPHAEMPDISAAMATSNLMDIAMLSVGRRTTASLHEVSLLSPLAACGVAAYASVTDTGAGERVTVRPRGSHSLAVVGEDLSTAARGPVEVGLYLAALMAHVPSSLEGDLSEAVACLTPLVALSGRASSRSHPDASKTLTLAGPAWISRDEAPTLMRGTAFTVRDSVADAPLRRGEVTAGQLRQGLRRCMTHTSLMPGDVVALEIATVTAPAGSRLRTGIGDLGGFAIDLGEGGSTQAVHPSG
jgi:hypothetical protein